MVPLNSYCEKVHQVVTSTKRLRLSFATKVPERVIYEPHSKGSILQVHAVNTVGNLIEYLSE